MKIPLSSKTILGLAIATGAALVLLVPMSASRRQARSPITELPEPEIAPYVAEAAEPDFVEPQPAPSPELSTIVDAPSDKQVWEAGWSVAYERGMEAYSDASNETLQQLRVLLPNFQGTSSDPWQQGAYHGHVAAIEKVLSDRARGN
jgi:hypothetical protein